MTSFTSCDGTTELKYVYHTYPAELEAAALLRKSQDH